MGRGYSGYHERSWVWIDTGYHNRGRIECELEHEVKSTDYGTFGVAHGFGYDEHWWVIWRPNRNYTQEWKISVMSEMRESQFSWEKGKMEYAPVTYDTLGAAVASLEHWQKSFLHPPRRKRSRPRDSQKSKVYKWEHLMADALGEVELDERGREVSALERKRDHMYVHMFLNDVCRELGESVPELKFRTGGRHSFGGTKIQLLPCHCNHLILLHELAHVLHRRWGRKSAKGVRHQSHGQEFVGIYAYLLIRFANIDKFEIIRHALRFRVQMRIPEQYWVWVEGVAERRVA